MAKKMSNVAVTMQSALGVAKTITAISKAAPGVVTATHDFNNGDYVLMKVVGMAELNNRVYRVCNKSTTVSFSLEDVSTGVGIDTTALETFISGTAQKITFGTGIDTAANITISGGNVDFIDVSTIHSNQKMQQPGSVNAVTVAMEHLWDLTNTGQLAMKAASDANAEYAFKFVFGTGGSIMVFYGFVSFTGIPKGNAQDKITTESTFTVNSPLTFYTA